MSIIEQMNVAKQAADLIKTMREKLETSSSMTQQAIDVGREASNIARGAVDAMRQAVDLLADGKVTEAHKLLESALGIHHDMLH